MFTRGMTASMEYTFSHQNVRAFGALVGDYNKLHMETTYAQQTPFKGCIVHGAYVEALVSAVLGTQLPGLGTVYEAKQTRFLRPVYVDETVWVGVKITKTQRIEKGQRIWLHFQVRKENGKPACEGTAIVQYWPEMTEYSTLRPHTNQERLYSRVTASALG